MMFDLRTACSQISDAVVLRDGGFNCLGLSNSSPGAPFLCFAEDPRYVSEAISNPSVSCLFCSKAVVQEVFSARPDVGVVLCSKPRLSFFRLHNVLCSDSHYAPSSVPTVIDSTAIVSPLAYVAPENVEVGPGVVIEPFASVVGRSSIGAGVIVRSGAHVGHSGFEYKRNGLSTIVVEHVGRTVVGNRVEIKSNASIDAAVYPWDSTVIGADSMLNAGAHVDHGARVGRAVLIGANAVVSGRVFVGDGATIGPGAVISNRAIVGSGSRISLGAVVTKDVPAGGHVSGNFAVPHAALIRFVKELAAKQGSRL